MRITEVPVQKERGYPTLYDYRSKACRTCITELTLMSNGSIQTTRLITTTLQTYNSAKNIHNVNVVMQVSQLCEPFRNVNGHVTPVPQVQTIHEPTTILEYLYITYCH